MILRTYFDSYKDKTITIENEEGEPFPEEGDVIYLDGFDDEGIVVGRILYDKYNVRTYEILELHIEGSFGDRDLMR
jgi:hypothetical protein